MFYFVLGPMYYYALVYTSIHTNTTLYCVLIYTIYYVLYCTRPYVLLCTVIY